MKINKFGTVTQEGERLVLQYFDFGYDPEQEKFVSDSHLACAAIEAVGQYLIDYVHGGSIALAHVNAIAPPVAAGSVESLTAAIGGFLSADGCVFKDILAWGAQQREAGRQEVDCRVRHLTYQRNLALAATKAYSDRAEKAEARASKLAEVLEVASRNLDLDMDGDAFRALKKRISKALKPVPSHGKS